MPSSFVYSKTRSTSRTEQGGGINGGAGGAQHPVSFSFSTLNYKTMRLISLLGLLLATLPGLAQNEPPKSVQTEKYSGIYSFGESAEKGPVGRVIVYAETDTTVLFFIDVCRGAPSYNLGQHYGRIQIEKGKGIYFSKKNFRETGCKWHFSFDGNVLGIKTIDNCYECGFGGNVIADNEYVRKEFSVPEYFIDMRGTKIHFRKTPPEEYSK